MEVREEKSLQLRLPLRKAIHPKAPRLSTHLSKSLHLPRKQLGLTSHRLLQLSLQSAQLLEFVQQPPQPLPIKRLMQPRLELPSPDFPTQFNRLDCLCCLQRV